MSKALQEGETEGETGAEETGNSNSEEKKQIDEIKRDNLTLKLVDAVRDKDLDMVKYLTKEGAYLHKAFLCAVEFGSTEIVQFMIDNKVRKHKFDSRYLTTAIKNKQTEIAKLLIATGSTLIAKSISFIVKRVEDPLATAIIYQNIEIIKILVSKGKDINEFRSWIMQSLNVELIEYAITKGFDINEPFGITHKYSDRHITRNYHPLKYAIIEQNFSVIRLLILNGAKFQFQDYGILKWANENKHPEVSEYMKARTTVFDLNSNDIKNTVYECTYQEFLEMYKRYQNLDIESVVLYGIEKGNLDLVKFIINRNEISINEAMIQYANHLNQTVIARYLKRKNSFCIIV